MATELPKIESLKTPLRRSSSKSFKGIIRIFRPDSSKSSNMKIRIPSFREHKKTPTSVQSHPQELENLLKEIVSCLIFTLFSNLS
ncbi:unnamed protein product [Rodentolepis nana]|uniref:Ovule protein n=1 Tax=Rodentolepis nana TaxID=102285 RepID=A0A0R3T2U1_RODNA|nr:unnamed protein product [Rodentolepis nana]